MFDKGKLINCVWVDYYEKCIDGKSNEFKRKRFKSNKDSSILIIYIGEVDVQKITLDLEHAKHKNHEDSKDNKDQEGHMYELKEADKEIELKFY